MPRMGRNQPQKVHPCSSRSDVTSWPHQPERVAGLGLRSGQSVETLEGRALLENFIPCGGHEYAATDDPLTWQQAENQAVKLGGHLAAVTTQAEQDFLTANFAIHEDIWIGLSDHANKGRLTWTTGEPVDYTAYFPGEPNNLGGAEDFVQMNLTSGLWNDNSGTAMHRGIIELNHPPTSAGKIRRGQPQQKSSLQTSSHCLSHKTRMGFPRLNPTPAGQSRTRTATRTTSMWT